MKFDNPSAQAATIARLAKALSLQAETREPLTLVGSHEAIERLGINRDTFYSLRRRGNLPEPVAELACGPIWRIEDIEAWSVGKYPMPDGTVIVTEETTA